MSLRRGLVRIDATGAEVWVQPDVPDRVFNQPGATQDLAVDEAGGVVWLAMTIPTESADVSIGAASVRDCDRTTGVGTSILVRLDLASGDVLDVALPGEGLMISSIALAPSGGVVLTG